MCITSAQGQPVGLKVSADRGDAAVTLTLADARVQYLNTALTAGRAVTMPAAGAFNGDTFRFVRTASSTGAFNWTAGPKALATGQWADVTWNGAAWIESFLRRSDCPKHFKAGHGSGVKMQVVYLPHEVRAWNASRRISCDERYGRAS